MKKLASLPFPVSGLGAEDSPVELEGDGEVAEGGEGGDAFVALGAGDDAEVDAGKRGELLLAQARRGAGTPQEIDQAPGMDRELMAESINRSMERFLLILEELSRGASRIRGDVEIRHGCERGLASMLAALA